MHLQIQSLDHSVGEIDVFFFPTVDSNLAKILNMNPNLTTITITYHCCTVSTGETDGSSFPNGGLRATHTAGAYLSVDPTSPIFLRGTP